MGFLGILFNPWPVLGYWFAVTLEALAVTLVFVNGVFLVNESFFILFPLAITHHLKKKTNKQSKMRVSLEDHGSWMNAYAHLKMTQCFTGSKPAVAWPI